MQCWLAINHIKCWGLSARGLGSLRFSWRSERLSRWHPNSLLFFFYRELLKLSRRLLPFSEGFTRFRQICWSWRVKECRCHWKQRENPLAQTCQDFFLGGFEGSLLFVNWIPCQISLLFAGFYRSLGTVCRLSLMARPKRILFTGESSEIIRTFTMTV